MLNKSLLKIEKENAFSRVTAAVNAYKASFPEKKIISLGIGDVTKPVCKPIIQAMHKAVDDLGDMETFQGYGSYYGLPSLREKIRKHDYDRFDICADEIYIGDGCKSDSTNILELFDVDSKILMCDPIYPIYKNGSFAYGRDIYTCQMDDQFKMIPPDEHYDLIYICNPNNPIGNAYTYEDLKKWVDYALKNHAVILYDNVYNAFITDENVPDSIYELEGALRCAVEFRSFSKIASFTGLRCSYYVIPEGICDQIGFYWKLRTLNRFNGASYVAQKAAEAVFEEETEMILKENIASYLENASFLKRSFEELGFQVLGGVNAPYMWIKVPQNSWDFFDMFLKELNIIVIPGVIFGKYGENHIRVSALGKYSDSVEAVRRMKEYYEKA